MKNSIKSISVEAIETLENTVENMITDKINNSFGNISDILFRLDCIGDTDILSVNKNAKIYTSNYDILRSDRYALILPSLYSVSITEEINNYINNKADIIEVSDSIINKIISDINYQLDLLAENNKYTKKYIYYYKKSNIIISEGLIFYKASIALIDEEC